jgi:hypothetical protein
LGPAESAQQTKGCQQQDWPSLKPSHVWRPILDKGEKIVKTVKAKKASLNA